ncbi:gonadotropin-releasing hormone II receptor [Trichonephila clavata]|uniref:Gonadotropin-releasing hormone II receptor n=1 Tax=Trichonephila clavata TaxID=2740835 RepID=A0A8X6KZX5_TRICU|nr:gonadotropin-releasing hormone II receptor [Trichonephila clavata]
MEIGRLEINKAYIGEYYNLGTNESYNRSMGDPVLRYYFSKTSVKEVVFYSLMLILSASVNLPALVTLIQNRHRKSRVNMLIMHLSIADFIVTFVMIPLEIAWKLHVQWMYGNVACKVLVYMKVFGPYLSSSILVCISLDRYFAIIHPLKVYDAQRKCKIMLGLAWAMSIFISIPQKSSSENRTLCNVFVDFIILADMEQQPHCRQRLRCSNNAHTDRALIRTLRMTLIAVLAFFLCWTPYVIMVLWYLFNSVSAEKVNSRIQSIQFMFAVFNSCVNPLVYGSYVLNFKKIFTKCCCKRSSPNTILKSHTPIITAKKKSLIVETIHRDVSEPNGRNGDGTYSALVKDKGAIDHTFHTTNLKCCSYSSSCDMLCDKKVCVASTSQKVEVVIHSLDR